MKILVCTDGSKYSQKALEMAAKIAQGCGSEELAVIHVYYHIHDTSLPFFSDRVGSITVEQIESLNKMREEDKKERKKTLTKAAEFFRSKGLKVRKIFKEGYPSQTIVNLASQENFDLIVLGSRGLSGFKKVFLGSVSNSVIQEARNCSILIVK